MNQSSEVKSNNKWIIGIVGTGTMGMGIAQVAASAGHLVFLYDARPGIAQLAIEQIGDSLKKQVVKGRLEHAAQELIVQYLTPIDHLQVLAKVDLVIEAISEDLVAKQNLFKDLEALVGPSTILASNTSSISITAIANGLSNPKRLIGMHFFNPVPLMQLVEVVLGAQTDQFVADMITQLARSWGKTAVQAKSTPGFIVNRVARPFYAEALALLQERACIPEQIDQALRDIGFRMGPCELMDLIGHDVNYSVTSSMFDANYGDRRYVPSIVQKALVDGGRLGRKSQMGFYAYSAGSMIQASDSGLKKEMHSHEIAHEVKITLVGTSLLLDCLGKLLKRAEVPYVGDPQTHWQGLRIGELDLMITDGRSATQVAAQTGNRSLGVIDLPLNFSSGSSLAISFAPTVSQKDRDMAALVMKNYGIHLMEIADTPGLIVGRTIAMLINEAADAVQQGVSDKASIDTAMQLGTSYPMGPFAWLEMIGIQAIVVILNHLFEAYRSDRYRISILLQKDYYTDQISNLKNF